MTTFCRYHCRACDSCFVSLGAFDAHRVGEHAENTRECVAPGALTGWSTMVEVQGLCRISEPPTARPRVIWRLLRDVREAGIIRA